VEPVGSFLVRARRWVLVASTLALVVPVSRMFQMSPGISEPVDESGAGALTLTGRALCFEHAGQNFGSRPRPPGSPRTCPLREETVPVMREPQEIEDAEYEQILERVCAIDVARASGKVCTRVPHLSRPGKRRTRVGDVDATANAVLELGGHLAAGGSGRSPWNPRAITGGSGSTCWKPPAWTCSWPAPVT
jgi:hypothetical protein